jgi:hypothetical protein
MSTNRYQPIVESIAALPEDWHKAGGMSKSILEAIAAQCVAIAPVRFSVETGSGKTTLLFSHASEAHKVFAKEDDGDGSITQVQKSELLNRDTVEYIYGPTQRTLASYEFSRQIDIALIDGPHGYPFPDLDYFHLYPHIRTGGILLIDDVQIPTIQSMFQILKADAMWALRGVVDNMAILERTAHPAVPPDGDHWWVQGYNLRPPGGAIRRLKWPIRMARKAIFEMKKAVRGSGGPTGG